MSKLPPSWAEIQLGEAVDYGKTSKVKPAEIPNDGWLLELEDIEKDTSKLLVRIAFGERRSKSTKNRFSTGDVLYGKLRPYLNKVLLADRDGFCTTEIVPLKANSAVDGGYLFHWIRHPRFLDYVTNVSHGLNMPRLGSDAGRQAPFIIAPMAEQKRIADKLDILRAKVDSCRERLDRIPQILKKFREAVLEAAVSGRLTEEWRSSQSSIGTGQAVVLAIADARRRLGLKSGERRLDDEGIEIPENPLPESWVWCRVGQIADVRLGGTPSRAEESYWNGPTPWVSSGEVSNGRIERTRETISNDGVTNSNAKVYPAGSVLIAMIGEGKTRGQSAILDIAASTNQNVAGLVFDGGEISSEYVWIWALGQYERTRSIGRGGNQPALNGAKVRALPIPVPPRFEQDEVVSRVQALLTLADSLQRGYAEALRRIEKVTLSVLTKAFRGELVPQDPNDEPAGEMLERMRCAGSTNGAPPTKIRAASGKRR